MIEIRSVSEAFLSHLSEEDGLFIVTQYGNGESYIAVNNLDGRGWIERFQNRTTAIYWLLGHWCLNLNNELCDGTTGQKILDIADKVGRGVRWR